MKSNTHLAIITNSTNITLESELDALLQNAKEVFIGTAFINLGAVKHLRRYLENKKQKAKYLKLLVGLYRGFNSPQVLKELIRIQKSYPALCQIRVARNYRFHWKCYLLNTEKKQVSFVGSSNFTDDGIGKSGEFVTRITEDKKGAFASQFEKEFNKVFDSNDESFDIANLPLKEYEAIYKSPEFSTLVMDQKLSALLRKPVTPKIELISTDENYKVRLIMEGQPLAIQTQKIIKKYRSHWDKLGYSYTCYESKNDYNKSARAKFLFFQEMNNKGNWEYNFYQVKDSTDKVKTNDGNYFVAYKKVKGCRPISQVKLEDKLRELNIKVAKRRTKIDKDLGKHQARELMSLFKINRQ